MVEELEIRKKENQRLIDDQKKRNDEIQQLLDEKNRVKALQLEIEQENERLKKIKEDQQIEIEKQNERLKKIKEAQQIEVEKQKKKLEREKKDHEQAALVLRRQAEEDERKKRHLQDEINRNQLELIRQKEDLQKLKEQSEKKERLNKEKEQEDKKARDKLKKQLQEADRKEPLKKVKAKDQLNKPQDQDDIKEPLKNDQEDKDQQAKDKLKKPLKQLLKNDKEDEDKKQHIDESDETKSGDTKDIKQEPDGDPDLMFEFDSEGLPIWVEKEIPLSLISDVPPKWEYVGWFNYSNEVYKEMRKDEFQKLYAKREKKLLKRRARETKMQADMEKKKNQRKMEMEESGRKQIQNYMFEHMRKLNEDTSDDEDEEEDKQEKSAKPNAEDEMLLNQVYSHPMEELENTGIEKFESKNPRQSKRLKSKNPQYKSKSAAPETSTLGESATGTLTESTVEILTNPQLMTQLEILQDLTLIFDPSVLQAIRDFNSSNVHLDFNQRTTFEAQEQLNQVKSVEVQEQFNQEKVDNIKKEGGQSQKRKRDDLKTVWSSINVKKPKTSTVLSTTVGSPVKGKISTRDAPEENIKDLVPNKLDHIKSGDAHLVKSSSSVKNQAQKVSSLVSKKYKRILNL